MTVYMLKFSSPIGNPDKRYGTAQFYLGYCADNRLDERLAEHRAGRGAFITAAAIERGLTLHLVMVIPKGTRKLERQLKNWKSHRKVLNRFPMFARLHSVV